jgi:hypothetical protein
MKTVLMIIGLLALSNLCHAQWFKEWFQQKKTQKEYLIEQIAQYKIYLELLEKGYKIAQEGLETIHDIKNGEFKLHKNYMDSLRIVGVEVGKYPKIRFTESLYSEIKVVIASYENRLRQSGHLNSEELSYVKGVYSRLLADCERITDALKDVTEDGPLAMSDDERFKRIDLLYGQMQSNYSFTMAFSNEAAVLAASRLRETDDIKTRRAINDTP